VQDPGAGMEAAAFRAALAAASKAITPEARAWLAEQVQRPDVIRSKVAEQALARANTMRYRLFGGGSMVYMPVDYVVPAAAPPAAPKITGVLPSTINLLSNPGGPIPQEIDVAILGTNLAKGLDLTKAKIRGDGAAFIDAAAPLKASGDALVTRLSVTKASGIVIEVPVKDSKDSLSVPPITVNVAALPPLRIERWRTPLFKWLGGFDRFDFSAAAPPDVVKAEAEGGHPGTRRDRGPVNVQIQSATPPPPAPAK
jgi:hypothetical protein